MTDKKLEGIVPIIGDANGSVPAKVWANLYRKTIKLAARGYFFPLDARDAYHHAIAKVESSAERLRRGGIVLGDAAPATYLTSVAYTALYQFHLRKVQPCRTTYRSVERTTVGRGAAGDDGFDIDNYDGTEGGPGKALADICGEAVVETVAVGSALTAQQLVEALPGVPSGHERKRRARRALAEICVALVRTDPAYATIVRGFVAYVESDGDMRAAANRAGMSRTDFYRKWPVWLAIARSVAEHAEALADVL